MVLRFVEALIYSSGMHVEVTDIVLQLLSSSPNDCYVSKPTPKSPAILLPVIMYYVLEDTRFEEGPLDICFFGEWDSVDIATVESYLV